MQWLAESGIRRRSAEQIGELDRLAGYYLGFYRINMGDAIGPSQAKLI